MNLIMNRKNVILEALARIVSRSKNESRTKNPQTKISRVLTVAIVFQT